MKAAIRIALCVFSLLVAVQPARAFLHMVKDGPQERAKLVEKCEKLFEAGKFTELDKLAARMRREQSRLPEGLWEIGGFYVGIIGGLDKKGDRAEQFAQLDRWEKAVPGSITARIARAREMVAWAWDARGTKFANEMDDQGKPAITDEAWKTFAERLAMARKILESDSALKQCPVYYTTMLTIAKGEGWSRPDTERLFQEGIALAPTFEGIHAGYADYLQLKWYGETPTEWQEVAARMADELKDRGGASNYTRLMWARYGPAHVKPETFARTRIDWARMKAGFLEMEQTSPGSRWNKNAFAYYAYAAGDKVTARRLFTELDNDYAKEIWRTRETYKQARAWAE